MTELEQKIESYADAYYNGNEQISDKEYDLLIARLRAEQPDSELLDSVCGEDEHIDGFKKGKHFLITGTLLKLRDEGELKEWFTKHPGKYFIEEKIDGAGIELKYEHGKLVEAVTRGTGFEGDIITDNIRKIPSVVQDMNNDYNGSVRGEVILYHENFKKYFGNMANPRNATAGIMKHLDGSDCDKLNFIAYELKDKENAHDNSESDKLQFLSSVGFTIPNYGVLDKIEDILQWRENKAKERPNLDYDIDGIVLKSEISNKADLENRTPKFSQIAVKFDLTKVVSIVNSIEWRLSGKYFAPVAHINPIHIDGTTVSQASVSNLNQIKKLGLKIGSVVTVKKCGEIIPQIDEVIG